MDLKIKEECDDVPETFEYLDEVGDLKNELYTLDCNNKQEEVIINPGSQENNFNYFSSYKEFLNTLEKTPSSEPPTEELIESPPLTVETNFTFKCSDCNHTTKHQGSYLQHLAVHTYPYKCMECHFGSMHRFVVINHYQMNHVVDTQETAHNFFDPQDAQELHTPELNELKDCLSIEPISTDSKIFKRGLLECTVCNYSTTTTGSLESHMEMHVLRHPYKCNKCDFTAQKSYVVFNHYQLNHVNNKNYPSNASAAFKCHVCSFLTMDRDSYNEHALNCYILKYCYLLNNLITSVGCFSCNMCDFKASHSFVLSNHVRMAHEFKNVNEQVDNYIPIDYISAIIVKDEFAIAN